MTQRIVFQPDGMPLAVVIPAPDTELTLQAIGEQAVPTGLPFWVIDLEDLPEDRAFRDAWELDTSTMGDPAGYGGGTAA